MQLVYEASKHKNGSLIFISEGSNDETNFLKYLVDSYIKLEKEEILGLNARKIIVLKDRDYPVSNYPFYFTFHNVFKLFEASYSFSALYGALKSKVKGWERPFSSSVISEPGITLYVQDTSLSSSFSKLYRYWLVVDYLLRKRKVVYLARPDEDETDIKETIKKMDGHNKGLIVAKAKGNLEEDLQGISNFNDSLIVSDLLTWETEALIDHSKYEFSLRRLLEVALKMNLVVILFAYSNYLGLSTVKKYALRERWLLEKETHVFLRTLKPPGPLYYVKLIEDKEPGLNLYMML